MDGYSSNATRSARREIREFLNPRHLLASVARNRELIWQLSRREVRQRYQGSFLGIGWALITPLATLGVYTLVFGVIFSARWEQTEADGVVGYAIILFAGMIAYNVFGETIGSAPSLVASRPNYVKKVVFPLEILTLTTLAGALFHSLIGVGIIAVLSLLTTGTVSSTIWMLPLAYIPLLAMTAGLTWILAAIGVFYRDLDNLIGIVVQLLFFLTPILYPLSAVPESIRPLMRLNPLTTIVEDFRRILLWGLPPNWEWLALNTVLSAAVALLGYTCFMALRRAFADVL